MPMPTLSMLRPQNGTVVITVSGSIPAVMIQLVSNDSPANHVMWSDNYIPLLLPAESVTITFISDAPVTSISVFVFPYRFVVVV